MNEWKSRQVRDGVMRWASNRKLCASTNYDDETKRWVIFISPVCNWRMVSVFVTEDGVMSIDGEPGTATTKRGAATLLNRLEGASTVGAL